MKQNEIWKLDAVETAAEIQAGTFSSREATEAAIARMQAVNPTINAMAKTLESEALEAADAADAALVRGESLGPLHGVPITVKINVDLKGHATTNGLVPLKDAIAETDSAPVSNLKKAGAVIIGQTNIPAFCYRWFSSNDLHGTTANPWDITKSPGGSSGGAAAAAATGIGTLAHGNDVAGSLRLPAAHCGVYGMKATMGRIASFTGSHPMEAPMGIQAGASEGLIARSVQDIRLGLDILSQHDPRDPTQVPYYVPKAEESRPCKVALYLGDDHTPVHPEIKDRLREAAGYLSDAGYEVEEAAPPQLFEMTELWMSMLYAESAGPAQEMMFGMADERFRRSFEFTRANLPELGPVGYLQSWQTRIGIMKAWGRFFETYPVVITPTSCQPPFPIDHDAKSVDTLKEILLAYSPLPAIAGLALPAISAPIGMAGNMPAGAQIIARWFEEERCLSAAQVLENRIGTMRPIDPKSE